MSAFEVARELTGNGGKAGALLLDLNGTVSQAGRVSEHCVELLDQAGRSGWAMELLTGNTYGSLPGALDEVDALEVVVVADGSAKLARVGAQGRRPVVAIGNGIIDVPMLTAADLALGVFGPEGAAPQALAAVDLVFPSIEHALAALLEPARLVAGLRP